MLITINSIEVLEIFRLYKFLQPTIIINISLKHINKLNDGTQINEEIFFIKHVFFLNILNMFLYISTQNCRQYNFLFMIK